jgi:DnaJ family protein C protein 9
MTQILHSTYDDEARFIKVLSSLIASGGLPSLPTWESSIHDEKARLVRQKQGAKEAKEAEELAKELGVWDEFYGSGKASAKKGKKGKGKAKQDEDEDDHSALQALMLKRKKDMGGFFDNLAAKYAEPEPKSRSGRGKKRAKDEEEDDEGSPRKKTRAPAPPEIDDEEFAALQAKLFDKGRKPPSSSKPRSGKGKKSKA